MDVFYGDMAGDLLMLAAAGVEIIYGVKPERKVYSNLTSPLGENDHPPENLRTEDR